MAETDNLTFIERPPLRNPYLVCGLNGWLNSGEVAVSGIKYLIDHFDAKLFAEINTTRFHVYQIPGVHNARPVFTMKDGVIEETDFPNNLFYHKNKVFLFLSQSYDQIQVHYMLLPDKLSHQIQAMPLYLVHI